MEHKNTCKTSSWEPQGLPRTKQLMFHIFGLFKLFMCYLWISFPPRITNNATNVEWETHQPFSRQIVKVKNALESKKQGKLVTTSYFIFMNEDSCSRRCSHTKARGQAREHQGRPRDHHFPPFITLVAVYRCQSEEYSFYFFTQTTIRKREYFKLCFFRLSQLELNIKPISTLITETFASTGKKTVNGGCRKLFRHRLFWELFFICISLYAFANINKNAWTRPLSLFFLWLPS